MILKNKKGYFRFLKYFSVVSFACLIDFLVFNISYKFTSYLSISNLIAFLIGNSTASLLLQAYVFKIKKISQIKQFYYSIILSIFIFFISTITLKLLVEFLKINVVLSKIFSLAESFILNYLIRNIFFLKNTANIN